MRWFTFIFLLVGQACFGQASGYMGKKLLVTGEISFLNAVFNANHNMNQGLRKFAFNLRATADLDYVVARNASVGATFDVFATGTAFDWQTDKYDELLVQAIDSEFRHSRISGYGYGINYKIFRNPAKGGIAPVGSYVKFDMMLLDVRLRPFDNTANVAHSFSDQFFTPAISITLGRQRIFWDFLILRTGIQVGIVPMGISPYLQKLGDGIERGTQQQELRAHAEARLMTYYLLNVNFGVGFLLPFRKTYRPKES